MEPSVWTIVVSQAAKDQNDWTEGYMIFEPTEEELRAMIGALLSIDPGEKI